MTQLFSKLKRAVRPFYGVILLVFLIFISLFYFNTHQNLDELTHARLQEKFQQAIADYLEKNKPEITSIRFQKIWSENLDDSNKIKIHFSYAITFKEGEADGEMLVGGEAVIERQSEGNWLVKEFKILDSLMDFEKPLIIKAT